MSLHDIIFDRTISRINGVVTGMVTDNKDPDKIGRVKVKFPWLKDKEHDDEDFETDWCRLVQYYAGPERGSFVIPEIDDEVLVVFGHGDIRYPYVIGSLHNGVDKIPPYDEDNGMGYSNSGHCPATISGTKGEYDANDHKIFESRIGHRMIFDDSNSGLILFLDQTKNNYILIDSNEDSITIEAKTGNVNIFAKADTLNIDAKTILMHSSENTEHKCEGDYMVTQTGSQTKFDIATDWTIEVGSKMQTKVPDKTIEVTNLTMKNNTNTSATVGATADIKISKANIKADVMEVKAGQETGTYGMLKITAGQIDVGSQATLTVKGMQVAIQGAEVAMAGQGMAKVSGMMVEMTASGPVAIQGAMVKLN